jgi:hypothetical protein
VTVRQVYFPVSSDFPSNHNFTIVSYTYVYHQLLRCDSTDKAAHYHTFAFNVGALSLARHLAGCNVKEFFVH